VNASSHGAAITAAGLLRAALVLGAFVPGTARGGDDARPPASLAGDVLPLFKVRCVKCHGPAKREGKLSLASPRAIARGGKHGRPVAPGRPDESLLWVRVADDEMPPETPLPADEKALLRSWLEAGARGLPELVPGAPEAADHWAFAPLGQPAVPAAHDSTRARNPVDRFLLAALEEKGLTFGPEADRATLARRLALDLTGLPPTPDEVAAFLADASPAAYERMTDRFLASPRYGQRWGKYWLDAAGYADSNGYFAADTDRPLAYRYRDYVIRSWNQDRPLDVFLREQLAGDELAGFRPGDAATAAVVDLLVATHFLRNAPDGTGESDGNPDELRADRYAVLEGTIEVLGSALFGLTLQCARCHDHKFEPVTQNDYYRLQAVLYPAFPVERWTKPNERIVEAPLAGELPEWEAHDRVLRDELARLRADYRAWAETHRQTGVVLFHDRFDDPSGRLAPRWNARAPGDDAAGGMPPVHVDSDVAPGAVVQDGTLFVIEAGGAGNRWLSTAAAFDWTPNAVGGWVQATFDLIDLKVRGDAPPAARVGYYVALHDYDDNSPTPGGNVLFDGNPAGGAAVQVDYPGADAKAAGTVGKAGYEPGRRYGVRVTNEGEGKYRLEHLVDWAVDGKPVTLTAADLPDGGFGFEYCCGRSFVVDDVLIESGGPVAAGTGAAADAAKARTEEWESRRKKHEAAIRAIEAKRRQRPGRVAWVADLSADPPATHLLVRGVYSDRGPEVAPGMPEVLVDPSNPYEVQPPAGGAPSTGRRLAMAEWITRPESRAGALVARVTANRIWQQHFGTGLVATPENFGYSGAPPSNPALLEYLARTLIDSGWSAKTLHRLIVTSAAFRQVSTPDERVHRVDPDGRLLARYPLRRLDAEAVRDAMLAASGELDQRAGGPYVAVAARGAGDAAISESADGAHRRSVYLQQRRTAVAGVLQVFDAPSLVTNCTRRSATTHALQSLCLINSEFVRLRARALAQRTAREAGPNADARVQHAFLLAAGRPPTAAELDAARRFLRDQPARYHGHQDAAGRAWTDLCQMLLASNAFLYVE
jgi:hypothetical protein